MMRRENSLEKNGKDWWKVTEKEWMWNMDQN